MEQENNRNNEVKTAEKKPLITKGDVLTVMIALVLFLCASIVIKPTIVKGDSMIPTLQENNYLLLNKTAYTGTKPSYGDIVVFPGDDEGNLYIKRVIGTEGDRIEIKGEKVMRNGEVLDEPYINVTEDMYEEDGVWEVPRREIFVMGDNRSVSLDSRDDSVGCVDIGEITGKVMVRLYPLSEMGKVK